MKQLAVLKKQYRQDLEDLTKAYENRRKILKEALLIYSSAAELNEIAPAESTEQLRDLSLSPNKTLGLKTQSRAAMNPPTIRQPALNGLATPATVNDVYAAPLASASRDDFSESTESTANVNGNNGRSRNGGNYDGSRNNNNKRGKRGKGKPRGGQKSSASNDSKD